MSDEGSATGADAYQANRRYLGSVAYRLLGSVTDAEDVLQETWLRWRAVDQSQVADPRAYLTTIVTRLCYDQLGSARVRRESYYGEWLPEPLLTDEHTPDRLAELGEEVSLALLAVMEQLTPAERTAFVLHDVFSIGFDEIAATLDRTPDATRQLASRARRRVKAGNGRGGRVKPAEHRQAVHAFAAATASGDIQALLAVLDPDVVWHSDGGGVVSAAVRPILGADKVSRLVLGLAGKWLGAAKAGVLDFVLVNGEPGLALATESGQVTGVVAFTVAGGRITEAYVVVNPEKLAHLA
ncbi:RNA polymerase sigma factor SigJ [Kitasatospora sp. GP82]|uniref:RNA polymerase sigma factor SigJ n=1 Tax=Kitasatospora sp. GP82 TaxID=3035089 RepID=UPI0024751E87|nr:RNA polymerase sigma factor SigJ [Kitasatospora sp. GP82]MDH6125202.1 RNA polymerase sigma-70 factor (ECF subfamily) [Kitasatospora sp. GP82]